MTDTRELVERLRQWDGCWPAPGLDHDVERAADTITALSERCRVLEEALRPFAKAGELFPDAPGSVEFDQAIYKPAAGDEWSLCGDDLRRARAALTSGGRG